MFAHIPEQRTGHKSNIHHKFSHLPTHFTSVAKALFVQADLTSWTTASMGLRVENNEATVRGFFSVFLEGIENTHTHKYTNPIQYSAQLIRNTLFQLPSPGWCIYCEHIHAILPALSKSVLHLHAGDVWSGLAFSFGLWQAAQTASKT